MKVILSSLFFLWSPFCVVVSFQLFAKTNQPQEFNEQVFDVDEWASIIKTYESQVDQNSISVVGLHNLAVARFNFQDPYQAVAIWLEATRRDPSNTAARGGLLFALKKIGVATDTLSLTSHGPYVHLMSKLSARDFDLYKLTLSVATCMFLSFGIFLEFRNRLVFSRRPIFIGVIVLFSLWLALAWLRYNPGRWTAVTQANGAPLRLTPDQQSEVVSQVDAGRPIFILGNTFDPWLRAYLSDGTSGWISALDVRVFHETR